MTDRELMQQALDALESVFEGDDKGAEYWTVTGGTYEAVECMNAMRALRARLAQPEQEHSEQWWRHEVSNAWAEGYEKGRLQREWQGLTDEEMMMIYGQNHEGKKYSFGRAIEAKLKEKNT